MEKSSLQTGSRRLGIKWFTAVSFALYTVYRVILLMQSDRDIFIGVAGVIVFVIITVASFFALLHRGILRRLRSSLLTAGLVMNAILLLSNVTELFGSLNSADTATVLRFAVFVCSELSMLILLLYYLLIRQRSGASRKRSQTVGLMSGVIVLLVVSFVMECVLMLQYGEGVQMSLAGSVAGRLLYCLGFVGTAIGFMLPVAKRKSGEKEDTAADKDVFYVQSIPYRERPHNTEKETIAGEVKYVMPVSQEKKTHSHSHSHHHSHRRRKKPVDGVDLVGSASKTSTPNEHHTREYSPEELFFVRSLPDEQRPKGTTQKELAPDDVNYIMPSAQNNAKRVRRVRKKREYSPEELFFVRSLPDELRPHNTKKDPVGSEVRLVQPAARTGKTHKETPSKPAPVEENKNT